MSEQPVGEVTHYFNKAGVAGISIIEGQLKIGDTICVSGHTTDFQQAIESMQIEHESVEMASAGDQVGIQVIDRVRVHDKPPHPEGTGLLKRTPSHTSVRLEGSDKEGPITINAAVLRLSTGGHPRRAGPRGRSDHQHAWMPSIPGL